MPKLGMQPVRRRQLIEATIDTIEAHGFSETTIARISNAAGLSSGIIAHYFGGKNALLAATMRSLLTDLQREMIRRLRRASTPIGRIEAILGANFAAEQSTPKICAAWLSFYGQVPHSPELKRLHRIYVSRLRSNLLAAFRQLLPQEAAERAAEGMSSMIDGIWVRAALARCTPDAAGAHTLTDEYLRMLLDHHQTPGGRPDHGHHPGII
jgi:TetR/AcrR family transcriptional repressor of bet genes